ncbi:autotransporter outer membrane beta-barrel domain-containing protein [Luteibacter aegosomaticola]|uniref:autotransporter outer membrane beta-barrel domain-containing protein n=1 Tax=Luteibacter aegosomaticola TaxID=2911538 RepID=UPI001FF7A656|nr:autotransporter outer membrane beta-barrel domain-containing protein [Luteibacter aegosomaticola]UPG91807.1 autotransporter outer membrane beta-barrel domain-containing protein [Luteibacter aegosomaticola]
MKNRSTPALRPAPGARRRAVLFVAIATALTVPATRVPAQTTTVPNYNPIDNDGLVGATQVSQGATVNLVGNATQFAQGLTGSQPTKLQDLYDAGRIQNGSEQWIGKARLNPGPQNQGITVRDPITGTNRVVSVYNSANFNDIAPVTYDTQVPDYVNVGDNQYINMRIGQVQKTGGTLNVALGDAGAASTSANNNFTLVAKQSTLFAADGTGTADSNINWNTRNRFTFLGDQNPAVNQGYAVSYVSQYGGTFNVTDRNGVTTSHTVTNATQLKAYNAFLITGIQNGSIDYTQYTSLFNQAYTYTNQSITYGISANDQQDGFQPVGMRVVMGLDGAHAHGTVAAGATLEGVNTNGGLIRATRGATVDVRGTIGTAGTSGDRTAVELIGATGTSSGVINGGFFGSTTTLPTTYGMNVVDVVNSSTFTNNSTGIINAALGTVNGAGPTNAIRLGPTSNATNNGVINLGVTGSRSNGSINGVYINTPTSTFTNGASGLIYLGRGPQTSTADTPADVALNQTSISTGINVATGGTVTNQGTITLGSLTQNAAGILVTGAGANVNNAGTINVNGRASAVPRDTFGISVVNAGSTGTGIRNTGTINVAGVNGTGIKALSTAGTPSLVHSTGTINVSGAADPASGTRNYGVWIEGQGSATATGDIQGAVNLSGTGAIGIHARGRATVNVAAGAAPTFSNGTDQIGFFAYGNDAHINVAGGSNLNVSTQRSTLFRLDSGADFDGTGLSATVSGAQATGILGSGTGSVLNTRNAVINVTGTGAQGVVAEGGATGTIDAATAVTLTGDGAVAGVSDGQKHDLTGASVGAPSTATSLTSLATINSGAADVTGFIARNGGQLNNAGTLGFTGANTTGLVAESSGTAANSGTVNLSGPGATGVAVRSGGSFANTGDITVGDGTGVLVDSGASSLASGGSITTLGTGNAIENAGEISAITLRDAALRVNDGAALRTATSIDPASTATMDVDGAGTGYAFRRADGGEATGDLAIGSGFTIRGNGAGSTGIQALTSGAVTTAGNVDILNVAGGSALVAGTASSVTNAGTLTSVSTVAPVVDLANGSGTTFTNAGTVAAASPTALAVRGSGGNDTVSLPAGAVTGEIATGEGSDTFSWTGGTLNGGLTMGDTAGNSATLGHVDTSSTYHLLAGTGGSNTLTFNGTQARGGTFAADDLGKGIRVAGWNTFNLTGGAAFELTDNLTLAGSDVNIDGASVLYAGNNVHPVISAVTPGTANVANNGTIDLTNGSGSPGNTLTVDGNYSADGGRVNLVSTLDAGGPLAAQATDRLLVQGDASGETVLNVTPSTLSTGALTDLNRNGYVEAGEGISLVQVAGASNGGAFRLSGGYLAFGPYQYGLYAFQPGASDATQRVVGGGTSGNNYWDYRLANVLVCNGACPAPTAQTPAPTPPAGTPYVAPTAAGIGTPVASLPAVETRPALAPQVPNSIATPSALALYGYQSVSNLHRRLGETRNMDDLGEGLGGETFVRYFGGDYNVSSNRSFSEYGSDYDVDTHAVQVGVNIFALDMDRSTLRAGVAYTHGTTRLDPKAIDGYSHSKFDTNSIAMFVTWQQQNGFYIDAVAQGDRHVGDVDTARSKGAARVHGSGWEGSVEAGYPFRFNDGWELEPQLQLTRQHIGLRDQVDIDDITTHYHAFDQTIGRAGLRFDRTWTTAAGSQFTPYARANYIKGWGGSSKIDVGAEGFDTTQMFTGGKFGQMMEVGLGGTWAWRNKISVYGEADWQNKIGDAGARGWAANMGVRWDF